MGLRDEDGEADEDDDDDDIVFDDELWRIGGEEMDFLVGFGSERKALIFRDESGDGALSYSSMR